MRDARTAPLSAHKPERMTRREINPVAIETHAQPNGWP
jgi:hypothetical protein